MAKGTCRLSVGERHSSVQVACKEEKRHYHHIQTGLNMYSFFPFVSFPYTVVMNSFYSKQL